MAINCNKTVTKAVRDIYASLVEGINKLITKPKKGSNKKNCKNEFIFKIF
jgi:ribosomal protein L23